MLILNHWINTMLLTIKQLIDENEVVLHALFVEFAKVAPRNGNESIDELENKGGGGVASGHCQFGWRQGSLIKDVLCYTNDIDVVHPYMEKRCWTKSDNRWTDVGVGDYLDTKNIGKWSSSFRVSHEQLLQAVNLLNIGAK